MPSDLTRVERSSLVVELVGVAGAGKSSLSRALSRSNGRFVEGEILEIRRLRHVPFFLINAAYLLPNLIQLFPTSRRITRKELKMMVYLRGWHRVVKQQSSDAKVLVLDHGPVFKLTWLRDYGPGNLRSRGLKEFWDEMLGRWATRLDLLIWLDAPDATLLNRIHSRTSWHLVKDMSEQEGLRFLARYRRSYEEVISKLDAISGPKVVRLNSDQNSIREIMVRALASLEQ